jgi:hypothetical protein
MSGNSAIIEVEGNQARGGDSFITMDANENRDPAAERERAADQRDVDLEARSSNADERDRAADARDQAADERDRAADERDRAADQRESPSRCATVGGTDLTSSGCTGDPVSSALPTGVASCDRAMPRSSRRPTMPLFVRVVQMVGRPLMPLTSGGPADAERRRSWVR